MTNLVGKGFYIWNLERCGNGDPYTILLGCQLAGIKHVLIKIADGVRGFNFDPKTGRDLVPDVVILLKKHGITVWGWQYIYGYSPLKEAQIALSRIQQTGVEGFCVNAEAEFKTRPDDDYRANQYMNALRSGLSSEFKLALSTYRRPDYHPAFPFEVFLQWVDINMPQIYWMFSHDPVYQLTRSFEEYLKLNVIRPFIPTGSAWSQGGWTPTEKDVRDFLITARTMGFKAANFWSWEHTERIFKLWDEISLFNWPVEQEEPDPIIIEPEDDMDIEKVRALLAEFPNAQLVINLHMDISEESDVEVPDPGTNPPPPSNEIRYKVDTEGPPKKGNSKVKVRPSPGADEHDFVVHGDILYGPGKELSDHYYVTRKVGGDLIPGYVEKQWVKPY